MDLKEALDAAHAANRDRIRNAGNTGNLHVLMDAERVTGQLDLIRAAFSLPESTAIDEAVRLAVTGQYSTENASKMVAMTGRILTGKARP